MIKAGNFTFHRVEISLWWCRPYPIYAVWAATTGLCNHKSITPENVTLPFTCGCTHFPCKKSRDCYRSSPGFRCRRRSGCRPCLCNETPSNNHLLRSDALYRLKMQFKARQKRLDNGSYLSLTIWLFHSICSFLNILNYRSVFVDNGSTMLTWRQLAAAAGWVWCRDVAVLEGSW